MRSIKSLFPCWVVFVVVVVVVAGVVTARPSYAQTAPESAGSAGQGASPSAAPVPLLRAAISPTPQQVRTGPQDPAHVRVARATVLEWFSNKNVNVLPEEAVRKRLTNRLDLTSCPTDECARTIAAMLGLDFVIRVTVWENMPSRTSKFIEPTGVGVKMVFASPKEPPVEYSETVTHMDVAETARTASVHAWQIYEERVLRAMQTKSGAAASVGAGVQPNMQSGAAVGVTSSAATARASRDAVVQQAMQAGVTSSAEPSQPRRSTLDFVGPIALGVAGAVALGFGIASFASSSCDTYSTADPSKCLVGNDSNTGAGIALTAAGIAAIGGGLAWYFLAAPKSTPASNASSSATSRVSLSPTHIGYHLQF